MSLCINSLATLITTSVLYFKISQHIFFKIHYALIVKQVNIRFLQFEHKYFVFIQSTV